MAGSLQAERSRLANAHNLEAINRDYVIRIGFQAGDKRVTSGLDIGVICLLHVQFEHCINKNSVLIALHVTNNLQCIQLCETTCKKISTSASLPWALQT